MSDWKEKIAEDKAIKEGWMQRLKDGVFWEFLLDYALAVHKAIEEKQSCGECEKWRTDMIMETYNNKKACFCHELTQYTRADFYCADFTPKEVTE